MAGPASIIGSPTTGKTTSNTTFHGVLTSTDIATLGVQAGDGLVAFLSIDANPSLSVTPGWTIANQLASGTDVTGAVIYKVADGVDDHLTVTSGNSQMASWIVYRVNTAGGTFDGGASVSAASGTDLNNAAWTPASGLTLARLVFATRHADNSSISSTPPSSYWTAGTSIQHTDAQGASTQVGPVTFTNSSYNPGAWTGVSPAGATVGFTCGFEPAAAQTLALASTGASTSSGSASIGAVLAASGTGSSTGTGAAVATATRTLAATGSSTSGGSAAISALVTASATGASTSGGSAALTAILRTSSTGSSTSGGSVDATKTAGALAATGSSTSGGSASLTARRTLAATGASTSGGSAALTAILRTSATGSSTRTGTADLGRLLALVASGGAGSLGTVSLTATVAFEAVGAATGAGSANLTIPGQYDDGGTLDVALDIGPSRLRSRLDVASSRQAWDVDAEPRLSWALDATRVALVVDAAATRPRPQADLGNTRPSTDIGANRSTVTVADSRTERED